MAKRSISRGTFTVERTYPSAPAKVFAAFADPKLKARWHGDTASANVPKEFDFREGGREVWTGSAGDLGDFAIELRHHDIVENERIVYAYEVRIAGARHSVSLAMVEFIPAGEGTRVRIAEDGAFLDGLEMGDERQNGVEWTLDELGKVLAGEK